MSLALAYFGVSQYLSVPIAAAVLVLITVTGSFRIYAGTARYAVDCRKPDEKVRPEQFARHFPCRRFPAGHSLTR